MTSDKTLEFIKSKLIEYNEAFGHLEGDDFLTFGYIWTSEDGMGMLHSSSIHSFKTLDGLAKYIYNYIADISNFMGKTKDLDISTVSEWFADNLSFNEEVGKCIIYIDSFTEGNSKVADKIYNNINKAAGDDPGGTRHSCLVNLGGGMVTDLGGFAASTFKRGINFINIPTTLLSMVDASVGGKTGINFNGLKNEIGTFCNANFVLLCTDFLTTLDSANLLSGYAEMLKHGLISNIDMLAGLLNFDVCHIQDKEQRLQLSRMISDSVEVKKNIVEKDPKENGIRKALNLGHTFGHAFESWSLKRTPVLHGYAVAWGLVCELYLSHVITGFPIDTMRQTVDYIRNHYGIPPVTCDDYHELIDLMRHDKKNRGESINFTLLAEVGDIRLDQHATLDIIKEAIDFLREG